MENNFKVKLIPVAALRFGRDASSIRESEVAFDVTPSFSENRSVEYNTSSPVHLPGSIQSYKRTNSRTFDISAKLISRNAADAYKNMQRLQLLRAWTMPYFGATDTKRADTASETSNQRSEQLTQQRVTESASIQLRGAPPDVLYLYAYSTTSDTSYTYGTNPVNISRIPVVITSLNIVYPEDVDYIPTSASIAKNTTAIDDTKAVPFPTKMDVSISLIESHSQLEYEQFDLVKYKKGNLRGF